LACSGIADQQRRGNTITVGWIRSTQNPQLFTHQGDVIFSSREKQPPGTKAIPGVIQQNLGRIVGWIGAESIKEDVFANTVAEAVVQLAKALNVTRASVWALHAHEIDDDDLALEEIVVEFHMLSMLGDEDGVRKIAGIYSRSLCGHQCRYTAYDDRNNNNNNEPKVPLQHLPPLKSRRGGGRFNPLRQSSGSQPACAIPGQHYGSIISRKGTALPGTIPYNIRSFPDVLELTRMNPHNTVNVSEVLIAMLRLADRGRSGGHRPSCIQE
jgi:hypothetical protein